MVDNGQSEDWPEGEEMGQCVLAAVRMDGDSRSVRPTPANCPNRRKVAFGPCEWAEQLGEYGRHCTVCGVRLIEFAGVEVSRFVHPSAF